ncbi:MAG TPA: FtsH protease activity modulator HflK [Gammaproteobacteria bacterium]|nr:FtsH protease activity modulator HflK [Gammaproteobacteria bacterium]
MAWDDGDKNNPWRSDKDKGPADLDAVVRDFQRKLASLFRGGRSGAPRNGDPPTLSVGLVAGCVLLLAVVWAMTGFYKVNEYERGVVLRFGAFSELTRPGLRWHLPWPVEQVEKVNIGGTQRNSYRGSMLTRDENLVEVDVVVQYRATDPQGYLFNMRDPDDAIKDVTASAIREVIGKNLLDFILTDGRAAVARETQDLLQATLDSYGAGVTVYEVNLQDAQFPSQVDGAAQDAIRAREDRERRIFDAEAYSNDILPRARGDAEQRRQDAEAYRAQVVANAEGEADRFQQILAEYQKAPAVTRERLYIETLQEILAKSTKVLVDTDGGNNLLYLPLDQLMQRRGAAPPGDSSAAPAGPATNTTPSRSSGREAR